MSEPSASPEPEVFKNVEPYAIDVGGRMVAPGEWAELPPTRRAVDRAVDAGHLVAANTTPAEDQQAVTGDAQPVNSPVDGPDSRSRTRRSARTSTPTEES